ncbi:MAG: DUF2079 domain-containing protein [Candidatus Beckwithbacteria bacterium]
MIILVFSCLYSFISVKKHFHFQTFGWDTAVFDQQIYLLANFKAPYSSLVKMNGLGDHFQLVTLFLGAICYKLWENVNSLFVLQSFVACISAFPLYLLSVELLNKTKLSINKITILSLIISTSYLLSVPFQSMLTDEFHNEPFILTPLIFMIYFLIKKKWFGYWLSFLLVILNKEIFGLLGFPLGVYAYLKTRNIKQSLATFIVGVGVSFLLIMYLMPRLSGANEYIHFSNNNNPSYLIDKFISKPRLMITEMVNTDVKRKTIFSSFSSFGFLPILAPTELIAPVFSLAIRFYDNTTPRLHAFNNHYAAPFLPLLAVGLSFGVYNLSIWLERQKLLEKLWWVIGLYLFCFTLFQDYYFHGPLNSLFKPDFYKTSQRGIDAYQLIKQVPNNATIATHNTLLPHLSQRENFYLLPEIGQSEYIAVDLSDGPNKFSPLSYEETLKLVDKLLQQKQYQVVWQKNQSLLLKKL